MFAPVLEAHRRDLRVHCYRMAGSISVAEDLVDETFRRAHQHLGGCDGHGGRSTLRSRLHHLATDTCLDALADRPPRVLPPHLEPATSGVGFGFGTTEMVTRTDIAWLEPLPDHLWEPSTDRATIELAFVAALQHLPPRCRAVLLLHDVLGHPTRQIAEHLTLTDGAVAGVLGRARHALAERLPPPVAAAATAADEQTMARRYGSAVERADLDAFADLLADDVQVSLPPWTLWLDSRAAVMASLGETWDPRSPDYLGTFRTRATRANGQPAVASYRRLPGDHTGPHRAFALAVLRIDSGKVTEIVGFHDPSLFPTFRLPTTL